MDAPEELAAKAVAETDTDCVGKRIDSPQPEEELREGIPPKGLNAKEAGSLHADRLRAESKAPERTTFSLMRPKGTKLVTPGGGGDATTPGQSRRLVATAETGHEPD